MANCHYMLTLEKDATINCVLTRLLGTLDVSDQLLVYGLQVFAKKIKDFNCLLEILSEREIRLISFQDKLDTKVSVHFYTDVIKVLEMEEKHRNYLIKTSIVQAK